MNKFTKADEGRAAIFTDFDGSTYSCTIEAVTDNSVVIVWNVSRTSLRVVKVAKFDWHNLTLFPDGAMFATI